MTPRLHATSLSRRPRLRPSPFVSMNLVAASLRPCDYSRYTPLTQLYLGPYDVSLTPPTPRGGRCITAAPSHQKPRCSAVVEAPRNASELRNILFITDSVKRNRNSGRLGANAVLTIGKVQVLGIALLRGGFFVQGNSNASG